MKKNAILVASLFLVVTVGCSLAASVSGILENNFEYVRPEEPKTYGEILNEIRKLMRDNEIVEKPIQAYIITSVDAHQSEYISKHDNRIAFVSGFTGSYAYAIIGLGKAAIWTDSRYFLQIDREVDTSFWTIMKQGLPEMPTKENWLKSILPENSTVGTDPFLMPSSEYEALSKSLESNGHKLISVQRNLVDIVWKDRPEPILNKIMPHNIKYTGKTSEEKINQLRDEIKKHEANSIIITALDEIAWLLNLRGSDIESNPVFFAYIILTLDDVFLYVNEVRITDEIKEHFNNENIIVYVKEYDEILNGIDELITNTTNKIIISTMTSAAIWEKISKNQLIQVYSLTALLKCIKNDIEAEGLRNAHIKDGIALVSFLYWLENNVDTGNVTELSATVKLEKFRRLQANYRGVSFQTISAFGSNSAVIHYSPTQDINKLITRDEIYLLDSGGQYLDGTTDTTRTIHLGEPSDFQIDCFTRVLKGVLSVSSSVFPTATPGSVFDTLARKALWDVGLDYGHGTGHGIGSYLNVHEYPPSFPGPGTPLGVLQNMFSSIEPGFYKDGEFGIRIEDVAQIVKAENITNDFSGKGALTFYRVTLVPIQKKLIDVNLLNKAEVAQVNNYHIRIRQILGPILQNDNKLDIYNWLINQTEPIVV